MKLLDWAIVVVYLVYVIWDGIRMTKNSGNVEGYFLANRSLPWWAVGLSVDGDAAFRRLRSSAQPDRRIRTECGLSSFITVCRWR